MRNVIKALTITLFSVSSFMFSNTATAVPCSDASTGVFENIDSLANSLISVSQSCEDGTTSNDSETVLNDASFFGINSWVFLEKSDELDGSIGLTGGTPGATWGDFEFNASVWDSYNDVIVVLKDGGVPDNTGVKWSAYHLNDLVSAGSWIYGYKTDGNLKEISHLSVYAANPVPVPATVWLFGSGLLGLVGVARRKNRA